MTRNIKVHQGDSYAIPIQLNQDRGPLTPDMVEDIEICVGAAFTRSLKAGNLLQMDGSDFYYIIPTQEETLAMKPGTYDVGVRVKYKDVVAQVNIEPVGRITILPSIFKGGYLMANPKGLKGNLPGTLVVGAQGPPGPKGDPFTYEDFTEEQLGNLVGPAGPQGDDYVMTAEDFQNIVGMVLGSETIAQLQQDVADLMYVPIDITKISNNIGTVELGTAVSEMTVTWTVNKTPTAQTLDGAAVDVNVRSKTVDMTGKTSATLVVTDERGNTDTAKTAYNAYNGVYYGVMDDGATIDSAAILALTRKLQSGRTITFPAAPASQRIVFALPVRYGTPSFKDADTGFQADMYLASEPPLSFTNDSGYTEAYNVWLSTNLLSGSKNIAVT